MALLIDATNFDAVASQVAAEMKVADFIGLDTETQDDARHDGLNQLCGYDPVTRKKAANKKLVFDMNRTELCGFSLYTETSKEPYYVNLAHADVENRVPWEKAVRLLDAKPASSHFIAHNAPFELTVLKKCHNYDLKELICTLQMCVSAYGPDNYSHDAWMDVGQGDIASLVPSLLRLSGGFDPNHMSPELSDMVGKVIAKESSASHSWNGLMQEIAYGYGLKKAVKSHLGHEMTTFEECLRGRAHMGQLTGAETADYGGEDAEWALKLFRHLLAYMSQVCPEAIGTFFTQENPMIYTYADIRQNGMRVDKDSIFERRSYERSEAAKAFRVIKAAIKAMLPFPAAPNEKLIEFDSWYGKNYAKYRKQVEAFANSPDVEDDYLQAQQVRGAVSNAWASDRGEKESKGINLSHYMPMRTIMYDLIGCKHIKSEGKTQSDGEARGKAKFALEKIADDHAKLGVAVLDGLAQLAGIEQRMKLYLTPYTRLTDPETNRMYPTITSMLASRRMASSDPNGMNLAKRGESAYVRKFFKADTDEEVQVSIDWSGIELVEIGEFSGDPEFIKAFGQIPHEDLHSGAAADILSVEIPGLNETIFKSLKKFESPDDFLKEYGSTIKNGGRLFQNLKGELMSNPGKAGKYWRTEVGKGANFNYWYSGWLHTIGERMGWDSETTKIATDRYRDRFHVAESWRLDKIAEVQRNGFITLKDGHRYTRYEATDEWFLEWMLKFSMDGYDDYNRLMQWMGNKIRKRANNQTVNADIQGMCASIAKRSILRVEEKIKAERMPARFMIPIHDELLWSVHHSIVPEFVEMARGVMIDHPDLFKLCKLDASPAIGLNFMAYDEKTNPRGQIELYEPPAELGLGTDRLDSAGIKSVVEYLMQPYMASNGPSKRLATPTYH